ncbi:BamA/TamA family outer membrane protein [Mucilaginibacter sp. X4EP1]|uniref:BamA/TamA family outer membrane protein n=1 Tax=Mucilaginibacter sp. X4EP1 TaxID=2723092 RepID=UPI002168A845|nr:BamA/TamA family outer membrane protein [Mucilaginibacter sp. X4EP1]MCS3815274.1 outer membrane protein assembly factor BamA [Mucilaginibacter sp. X4EP1]
MKNIKYLFCLLPVLSFYTGYAQKDTSLVKNNTTTKPQLPIIDSSKQVDAIDVLYRILGKKAAETQRQKSRKLNFSLVPAFGYSLSTGFAVDLTGNVAFYTSSAHTENLSEIDAEQIYDTKGQIIFTSRSEIWAHDNDYKFVTDLRLERYPEDTYGIGTGTPQSKENPIDFTYLRTYFTVFKKIIPDFYWGLGYNLDYHYNISQTGNADNTVSDFTKYGFAPQSTSSGLTLNLLYDSRRNKINPLGGGLASITYRDNFTFLGSNNSWQELSMEFKKFLKLSDKSNNVLAFWSIAQFTWGSVPYLDLPATGEDMYNNSGRGYPQDRFRGKNFLYVESEYRFGITKNGLIGGVVFANAESLSEFQTNRFQKLAPAAGTGLRIKVNKHSDTNVCLDYAAGLYGSHGIFVNLGEMF